MELRRVIHLQTHKHLGDRSCLTGAVRNVLLKYPGWFRFNVDPELFPLFSALPEVECGNAGDECYVSYGRYTEEQHALNGNLVEGFTKCLCTQLGVPVAPFSVRTPYLKADPDNRWGRSILINANCQRGSMTKLYPRWQEVVDMIRESCHGVEIVQIGGAEDRDVTMYLSGVTDMRGRTGDLRSFLSMVAGCLMVLTPPSAVMNIAAAFGKPGVVVNGAREPVSETAYPTMRYVHSQCNGWDGANSGCLCLRLGAQASRGCPYVVKVDGRDCASCMGTIPPESIFSEVAACVKTAQLGI